MMLKSVKNNSEFGDDEICFHPGAAYSPITHDVLLQIKATVEERAINHLSSVNRCSSRWTV